MRPAIVELIVKPVPTVEVIAAIKEFKNKGGTVVGITNQDVETHKVWRIKMRDQGHDPATFLDGALVTSGLQNDDAAAHVSDGVRYHPNNVFEVTDQELKKPDARFFKLLTTVVVPKLRENNRQPRIIYSSTRLQNMQGAIDAGLDGVVFPVRSKECTNVVQTWKQQLLQRGIEF